MNLEQLLEAQNYDDMFSKIIKIIEEYGTDNMKQELTSDIKEVIKDARKGLKKNDRIVWFLRIFKIWALNDLLRYNMIPDEVKENIKKEISKLEKKANIGSQVGVSRDLNYRRIFDELTHYLSLPIQGIQNYQFTNQNPQTVFSDFDELEEEWKDSLSEHGVEIQDGDEILIEFDGGKKAWWLLARGACRAEADAMGHCGNVPQERSGDRILSFRTATESEDHWVPHLTFILDEQGYLGEMKGRNNDKPIPKYHPYIVKLLKHKIVDGIKGGGYEPQNNFQLNDLPDDIRTKLIDMKPQLATLYDLYKKEGFTKKIEELMKHKIDSVGLPIIQDIKDDKVILQQWNDFEEFMDEMRWHDKFLQNYHDLAFGNEEPEVDIEQIKLSGEDFLFMIEKMTDRTLSKLSRDLGVEFDYDNIEDRKELANALYNSNIYDEKILLWLAEILEKRIGSFTETEKFNDYRKIIYDLILRASSLFVGSDDHDENFENIEIYLNVNDFIEMLDIEDEDGDQLSSYKLDVLNSNEWLPINGYDIDEILKYPEDHGIFDESELEDFENLKKIIKNGFKVDQGMITDEDLNVIVGKLENEMNLVDSVDMDRLKMLAGIV